MKRILYSQLIVISLLLLVYYSLSQGPKHYPPLEEILTDKHIGEEIGVSALPIQKIINNSYISFTTDFNQTIIIPLNHPVNEYNDKISAKGILHKEGDLFILEPTQIFLHNKLHRVYIRFPMSLLAYLIILYFFLKEFRFNWKKFWWGDR